VDDFSHGAPVSAAGCFMTLDQTLNQSIGEQLHAEELSLRATAPPSEVPGYRMERLLGQGAFGQVWIATNLNTGRTVAIKFYLHRSGVNWSLLTREVKNLVSMAGNRAIVQVLEVGWDAVPPYYVMEYLEHGSLDDLIRSQGSLPIPRAVELFTEIASGLNHSHGKGVLHCDLKPANVLLGPDMEPRIADFGQSRLTDEQTPSLGTLFYMAPEQADLNAVPDARWDVYALGSILYCMLVGEPPYRTAEIVASLDQSVQLQDRLKNYRDAIVQSPFPREHYRTRGMDRWLSSIIDRCIARRPEDRFANVQQVLAAIERRRVARLRRPLMLLGIVGPLLLLAIMGLFYWRAVNVAESDLSNELREGVLQSNFFAAQAAAGTLESEITGLFRLIEEESDRSMLQELYMNCVDQAGIELLRSLATEQSAPTDGKSSLQQIPARNQLDLYLKDRLDLIRTRGTAATKSTKFDSLFVMDRFGTMLASAFANEPGTSLIGENFAYRSYFSGQTQDLPRQTPRRNISRTQASHLSLPFLSAATNRWKIAVSTPISFKTPDDEERVMEGVMVLTINVGDLELLHTFSSHASRKGSDEGPAPSQFTGFAVLVDGHEGEREGTILQHPFFSEAGTEPPQDSNFRFQIDPILFKLLKDTGTYRYRDPIAQGPRGERYAGEWIAAMEPVEVSRRSVDDFERRQSTSLLLLIQVPASSITGPVAVMSQKLSGLFLAALLALLTAIVALWIFVLRYMRLPDSFAEAARARSDSSEGKSGNGLDGMPSPLS
jgi:serine/threonine protein kinase